LLKTVEAQRGPFLTNVVIRHPDPGYLNYVSSGVYCYSLEAAKSTISQFSSMRLMPSPYQPAGAATPSSSLPSSTRRTPRKVSPKVHYMCYCQSTLAVK
jgi:hypothetical protein